MAKPVYSDLDFQGTSRPTNLPASVAAGQPVIHEQLAAAIEGLNWKDSVRVATAANVNLAAPGANVDGIAMVAGDRFAAMGEAAAADNGIYIWNGAAVPATRALDMNTAAEVEQAVVTVEEGTNAGASFRQTAVNVNLGVTALAWVSFGTAAPAASEAAAGVLELATQAETDAGADDLRAVTPLKLKTSPFASRGFAANFGDAAATSFNIDHNLNTFDVLVEVVKTGGNRDTVLCDVQRTTVNRVVITASPAPALNALRALVQRLGA